MLPRAQGLGSTSVAPSARAASAAAPRLMPPWVRVGPPSTARTRPPPPASGGGMDGGSEDRQVVVAAVPDDDVRPRPRPREDLRVVHARPDDAAGLEVRFVLLALLDRDLRAVEIRADGEAL